MEQSDLKIPLFDLDIEAEERRAVEKVLRSKWLTMGDVTAEFERNFGRYLEVPHCVAVCNGTAALHLAVMALGIGPGDEVICPALTFVATVNAVLYAGAKPVFADIVGKDNFNMSAAAIESKITERSRAIMVVHYGGFPCNMEAIMELASKRGLKVIEDAAHAPGAEYVWKNGRAQKVGGIGDIGCFSFFSNKNLAVGEGGMVTTKDMKLADILRTMRSHGMTSHTLERHRGHSYSYDVVTLGYNYRIDEVRAAIGLVQLEKLPKKNQKRQALDAIYRERLRGVHGIDLPFETNNHRSSHHIFPVLLSEGVNRETFMATLRSMGIQTSIHYPPVHKFSYYRNRFAQCANDLKWTEYAGQHEVTLPLYPSMNEEQIDYIVDAIKKIFLSNRFQVQDSKDCLPSEGSKGYKI